MPKLVLRLDMRAPSFGSDKVSLYQAAVEMAAWADAQGFDAVSLSEHHGADDGYLPSPMMLAAAIAARTSRIRLRFAVLLLPFYHPLRLAEDLAVLDILSGGRVEVVFGAGYVPLEMAMFGVPPGRRGQLMERGIATLKQAWTGQPFEFEGAEVRVTPTPVQRPHPPLGMGGNSAAAAAARRAARLCDEFFVLSPQLYDIYREERVALGRPDPRLGRRPAPAFSSAVTTRRPPASSWRRICCTNSTRTATGKPRPAAVASNSENSPR